MSDFTVTIIFDGDKGTKVLKSDNYPVFSGAYISCLVGDEERIILLKDVSEIMIDAPEGFYQKLEDEQEINDIMNSNEGGKFH